MNNILTIATAQNGIAGFDPDKFVLNTSGFLNAHESGGFALESDGQNLLLTYTAVPERPRWGFWLLADWSGWCAELPRVSL